jgi:hypothetical protein
VECLGISLIMLVIGVFLLIVAANHVQRSSERWNRSFAMVAHRFGGDWNRGGWFRNPSLRMRYGATHARLAAYRYGGSGGPWCVEMVVHVPEPIAMRCEVGLRTPQRRLARSSYGLAEMELDWTDFRYNWQVLTDDADTANLLLSRAVRLQLDRLWKFPFRSEIAISMFPNWLIVRKLWDSSRPVDLESFAEASLGLYDQLLLARSAGIEFVEELGATILDDAECRICGEKLIRDIVLCRRCKTPHHRDCWEYAGTCAVYGCRETKYHMPSRPAAIDRAEQEDPSKPGKPR